MLGSERARGERSADVSTGYGVGAALRSSSSSAAAKPAPAGSGSLGAESTQPDQNNGPSSPTLAACGAFEIDSDSKSSEGM